MRCLILSVLIIAIAGGASPVGAMPAQDGETLTIVMKVTSGGLITTDVPVIDKKIYLPRGTKVRLVLEYADSNRNSHRFTLVSSARELESGTIDATGRRSTSLQFTVGESGVSFHRLSCEVLCIAMDHLTDYIFMVAKA